MRSEKAQGISLNFIVIAIIAALVLVIIIAFTVGGLGTSLSKIFQAGETSTEESDLDIAKASCESLCNAAKQTKKPEDWASQSYCTKTFTFEGNQVHCWEPPINKKCSDSGQDVYGAPWTCDETNCLDGCPPVGCYAPIASDSDSDSSKCDTEDYNECLSKTKDGEDTKICEWGQLL